MKFSILSNIQNRFKAGLKPPSKKYKQSDSADQEYWDQVGGRRGDPLASSPHLTCSEIRVLSWKEDEGAENYKW